MRNTHRITLVLFLAGIFSGWTLMAQTHAAAADSLRLSLETIKDDSSRVPVLIRLGQYYETNQPDKARSLYREVRDLSRRIGFERGYIEYVKNYTAMLNVEGGFDSSIALSLAALDIASRRKWPLEQMKLLSNLGAAYQYKEDFQKSLDYYFQALSLIEKSGMTRLMLTVENNISGLYRIMSKLDKAETYARLALELAKTGNVPDEVALASINLANVLKDKGDVGSAMTLLRKGYAIGKSTDNLDIQETALINLGDGYMKLKQPDRYLEMFKTAMPMADSLGDVTGTGLILQGLATGLYRKKYWPEAALAAEKALAFSRLHDLKKTQADLLMLSADIQIALGHPDRSDRYRDQYDSVRDLILNTATVQNVRELETKYEVEKSQRLLAQQKTLVEEGKRITQRQRFQLTAAIAGIIFLSGLLVFGFSLYRQRKKLNETSLLNLKAGQENLRLKAVLEGETQERRRISREMHDDMGSGLTSLIFQSRVIPGGAGHAIGEHAQLLVQKMNEIIWSMNDEQDSLDSLLAYIRKNAATTLETAGISYEFNLPESIQDRPLGQDFRRNVYLAVKEAIHNLVRHSGATEAKLSIAAGSGLSIRIADNGRGIGAVDANRFGTGIRSMQRRIEECGGQLLFESGSGTVISMDIPWPGIVTQTNLS